MVYDTQLQCCYLPHHAHKQRNSWHGNALARPVPHCLALRLASPPREMHPPENDLLQRFNNTTSGYDVVGILTFGAECNMCFS